MKRWRITTRIWHRPVEHAAKKRACVAPKDRGGPVFLPDSLDSSPEHWFVLLEVVNECFDPFGVFRDIRTSNQKAAWMELNEVLGPCEVAQDDGNASLECFQRADRCAFVAGSEKIGICVLQRCAGIRQGAHEGDAWQDVCRHAARDVLAKGRIIRARAAEDETVVVGQRRDQARGIVIVFLTTCASGHHQGAGLAPQARRERPQVGAIGQDMHPVACHAAGTGVA